MLRLMVGLAGEVAVQFAAESVSSLVWNTHLAIGIEAFAARFGRLQDHLGEKLIPRLPLSLLLAYPGRPRRRSAADTRPDAPLGASNCGF
jgi:hypothetical protein